MPKTFGETLREIRRGKRISLTELAEKVGVHFTYISKVETNILPPPAADTIVKICDVLEIPPDELLVMTGKMPTPIKQIIRENPKALHFLREALEIKPSDEEWTELTLQLKRLRS